MSDSHRAEVQNAKTTSEGGSANSSLTYDNVMQNQYSTVRRVHIFACAILGLDDSDHEDDDEAKPLEDAIMALLDSERERWIGEVKAALPAKKPSEAYYQEQANAVIVAERYGFNGSAGRG